ncbi:MAG: hypothetical protein IBX56_18860 [Methylomicrobium sp.]|nr:hypothetical protein [Methylomicrobium sp.]
MIKKCTLICLISLLMGGCTSITVEPLAASHNVKHICIRENPKVTVEELVPMISDGLARHYIQSDLIPFNSDKEKIRREGTMPDEYYMSITPVPDSCEFNLTYTARRSWDLGTYLSTADIAISDREGVVAKANYHLIGKGGLSLFKWQGVKTKLDPVMDELLQHYK